MISFRTRICCLAACGLVLASLLLIRLRQELEATLPPSSALLKAISPALLPPQEAHIAEFLLILPSAALIVCIFRNLIGLETFGTFAPALLGLAFREIDHLGGILMFPLVVLLGWQLRRVLDWFRLLQVPRTALMLSLICAGLTGTVLAMNAAGVSAGWFPALFPMVIMTGIVERFWSLGEEESARSSFGMLFRTLAIAGLIGLLLKIPAVPAGLVHYPESLGFVMAGQLLLGRYAGFRLLELYRFRAMMEPQEVPPGVIG